CLEGCWNPEREREVDWAIGAFLLIRREAWDAAGGFDDRQWMYAEDLDLGWRVAQAGWSTRYVPSARVLHHASAATTQAWGDERTLRWLRSTYAWMLRRRGPLRTRTTAAINVLGAYARARDPRFRIWGGLHRRAAAHELERAVGGGGERRGDRAQARLADAPVLDASPHALVLGRGRRVELGDGHARAQVRAPGIGDARGARQRSRKVDEAHEP